MIGAINFGNIFTSKGSNSLSPVGGVASPTSRGQKSSNNSMGIVSGNPFVGTLGMHFAMGKDGKYNKVDEIFGDMYA